MSIESMSGAAVADGLSVACLLLGAFLAMVAAIGLVRFPDLLSRMHAATKPQVLGLILIVIGLGLRLRNPTDVGMLVLIAMFQLLTAPVSAHMLGRTAFRKTPIRKDLLLVDELTPRLEERPDRPDDGPVGGER
ncbi:monovalent cation/H(+) antiporter subunit G [Solicola gregarius]|uniref:Monovalent cation/H(+) antiporter subunit G n=1 Tax=Solicola gregarius TaxID=2908642 RepID=A0AA46TEY7_9ACTN|nr:monovalent cation/H(+) antiporter subunit G [Solicola gregarius]UYM03572.1 monovalent cation/H(+) antiporter subunit G [Solicola gregarius]